MRIRLKSSFIAKVAAAGALVAVGDWLFWQQHGVGSNLGAFALVWAVMTMLLQPATWRNLRSWAAALGAIVMGASLVWDPTLIGLALFWSLLACAVLLPRFTRFDHVGRWLVRLMVHGATSAVGPWIDLFRLRAARRHGATGERISLGRLIALLLLPLVGGAVFLTLFALANPVISHALARLSSPQFSLIDLFRGIVWLVLLVIVWATLRPRRLTVFFTDVKREGIAALPGVTVGSVTLALMTFNALFALQNGLDFAFLWSGAPLPDGMTLAQYAHRGAYPLIATALLAGLFVLVCLRPGSDTAKAPLIRWMVVLWVMQNVFLVASSMLRTIDYIEVFSLTRLRIAALIWMALVAVGLVLILWRMLRGKSGAWLINANALTAGLVLAACCTVDLGSVAAAWNVRHAKEVGGRGAKLDVCYLAELGPSAYVSLAELERRSNLDPGLAQRIAWVRSTISDEIDGTQAGGDWTWRNALRAAQVAALKLPPPPATAPAGTQCGAPLPPDGGDAGQSPLTNGDEQ